MNETKIKTVFKKKFSEQNWLIRIAQNFQFYETVRVFPNRNFADKLSRNFFTGLEKWLTFRRFL